MVDDTTLCVLTTGAGAGVLTLVADTGTVRGAVGIDSTLRPTALIGVAKEPAPFCSLQMALAPHGEGVQGVVTSDTGVARTSHTQTSQLALTGLVASSPGPSISWLESQEHFWNQLSIDQSDSFQ
ncbi:hypothetical protein J6590_031382 [Homalodisca vitripennis]|nr:hypothetical protein J6590_031382 [Homalodisca vitripennis]